MLSSYKNATAYVCDLKLQNILLVWEDVFAREAMHSCKNIFACEICETMNNVQIE